MAMIINGDECTGCSDCEPLCPSNAISNRNGVFMIDAASCTECEGEFDCIQFLED